MKTHIKQLYNKAYEKGKADAIDELKSNIITHILRSRPLTLEEISDIVIFECEQLKEKKND